MPAMAEAPGSLAHGYANSGADGTHGANQHRYLTLCLPIGTMLPIGNECYVAVLLGSSSDKSDCLYALKWARRR